MALNFLSVFLAFCFTVLCTPAIAAQDVYAWGEKTTFDRGDFWVTTGWVINGIDESDPSTVTCGQTNCIVAPIPRTGLGPNGPTCDRGGVCNSAGVIASDDGYIIVNSGTRWADALRLFQQKYGSSGTARWWNPRYFYDWVDWDHLCNGFASLPTTGMAVSQLVPGTSCGKIPRPNLACNIDLPTEIDLGVVLSSVQSSVTATAHGSASCASPATMQAAIQGGPYRLDGVPVIMSMNGVELGTTPRTVGAGTAVSLDLSASVEGTFKTAGVHSAAVPIIVTYY